MITQKFLDFLETTNLQRLALVGVVFDINPTKVGCSLGTNKSLRDLSLSSIHNFDICAFFKGLKENHTLTRFSLSKCSILHTGAIALADMIAGNDTIEFVGVENETYSSEYDYDLLSSLVVNTSIISPLPLRGLLYEQERQLVEINWHPNTCNLDIAFLISQEYGVHHPISNLLMHELMIQHKRSLVDMNPYPYRQNPKKRPLK